MIIVHKYTITHISKAMILDYTRMYDNQNLLIFLKFLINLGFSPASCNWFE